MKRSFSILLFILVLFVSVSDIKADSYGSYTDITNSVVRVVTYWDTTYKYADGTKSTCTQCTWSTGSGFAVGKKGEAVTYFVTNRHVIEDDLADVTDTGTDAKNRRYTITYKLNGRYIMLDDKGTKYPIEIVTQNTGGPDLAIVKLKEPIEIKTPSVLHPFDDPTSLKGSRVWSIGYPGAQSELLETSDDQEIFNSSVDRMSIGSGVFSAVIDGSVAYGGGTLIQTDATINHGNSGGPLVDEKGGVLGVCTYGVSYDSQGNAITGINAAVSVNEVITLLDKNNIPYRTVNTKIGNYSVSVNTVIILLVVLAAAAVLFLLFRKKPAKQSVDSKAVKASVNADNSSEPFNNIELSPTKPYTPPVEKIYLLGISGFMEGRKFLIEPDKRVVIGRDPEKCNIIFPADTPAVSRVHCEIVFDGRITTIRDMNSSYGTFVNGEKLPPNVPARLQSALPIYIGSEKNGFTLQ